MNNPIITPVTSKTRRMKAKWTMESEKDLVGETRKPAWLWVHIDEVKNRLYYLTSGKFPSRWVERDIHEAMAAEITKEIDKEILEKLIKIYPGKNNP